MTEMSKVRVRVWDGPTRIAHWSMVILFGLSGHGHFDMSAYDAYFAGKLEDIELSQSRIDAAIEELPRVPVTQ